MAKAVVSCGLVTQKQLKQCQTLQKQYAQKGKKVTLAQVLIAKKYIDASQISKMQEYFESAGVNDKTLVVDTSQQEFGRYKIIAEIGRGGMGRVYKAHDPQLDRIVALKVLIAGGGASEEEIKRFLREAKATAHLRHPNIVSVYDMGYEQEQYFFTMDFIAGVSLKEFIKTAPKTRKALEIMCKVADAIAYSHSKGIVHRDLKPANIMLDKDNEPKVMDFGLAKIMHESTKLSKSGTVLGTLQYMPPEQAEGKLSAVDQRSDIYTLGAILYEILTGSSPFKSDTSFGLMRQILTQEPRFPKEIKISIPKALETITLKALEKQKEDRYQNALELKKDLKRFIEGKEILAKPQGTAKKTWQKTKKNPTVLAGLVTLLIIFIFLYGKTTSFEPHLAVQVVNKKKFPQNKFYQGKLIFLQVAWDAPQAKTKEEILVYGKEIKFYTEEYHSKQQRREHIMPIGLTNNVPGEKIITVQIKLGNLSYTKKTSFILLKAKSSKSKLKSYIKSKSSSLKSSKSKSKSSLVKSSKLKSKSSLVKSSKLKSKSSSLKSSKSKSKSSTTNLQDGYKQWLIKWNIFYKKNKSLRGKGIFFQIRNHLKNFKLQAKKYPQISSQTKKQMYNLSLKVDEIISLLTFARKGAQELLKKKETLTLLSYKYKLIKGKAKKGTVIRGKIEKINERKLVIRVKGKLIPIYFNQLHPRSLKRLILKKDYSLKVRYSLGFLAYLQDNEDFAIKHLSQMSDKYPGAKKLLDKILNKTKQSENKPKKHSGKHPELWPLKLWQECWDPKNKLVDFTTSSWRKLSVSEQSEYATQYQKWYAKKVKKQVSYKWILSKTAFNCALIPPGKFLMGAKEGEKSSDKDEYPQHPVTIRKPFWISQTEVTQQQWETITEEDPWSKDKNAKEGVFYPAVEINWLETTKFLTNLEIPSKLKIAPWKKVKASLPTEAQWEYAARGGTTTRFHWGDKKEDKFFWYKENTKDAKKIALLPSNPFELYDMLGNVAEWCQDDFFADYAGAPSDERARKHGQRDPRRRHKVLRGSSFKKGSCRCAARKHEKQDKSKIDIGVRYVINLE